MAVCIKEIGSIIKYQDSENINGMIRGVIEATGKIIICMAREFIHGLMAGNTSETGKTGNSTGKELTFHRRVCAGTGSGTTAKR